MLCPVREYEWIEPWKCDLIHTNSGIAELDCVFTARFEGEDEDDVWVVSRYEPSSLIEFVRTNSTRVMRYSIALEDNGDGTTTARNVQVLTALRGHSLDSYTPEAFAFEMRMGEAMLNHFLETRERLPLSEAVAIATAGANS